MTLSFNLRRILLTASLLFGVLGIVFARPAITSWRCNTGQAAVKLVTPPSLPSSLDPEKLRAWDVFAVKAIGRAVQGDAKLSDVNPLFETLLTQGLFAGAYAEAPETMSGLTDLSLRSASFLDAVRRLECLWNAELLREILADEKLVAALRTDTTSQADAGAVEFVAHHLNDIQRISALSPLVMELRECLSVADDLPQVAAEFEAGTLGLATTQLLAVTYLWDVRLYLQSVMNDELLTSALQQSDDRLMADFKHKAAASLLRWFILGGREAQGKAELWDAFDAPRFIAQYPDCAWVGHAAAMANELILGTVLSVSAEPIVVVGPMGESAPYSVTVRPAKGATYATPALVWPRAVQQAYQGFRCLQETSVELSPAPVTGEPMSTGLRYELIFNQPGEYKLSFQYQLYGINLPVVEIKPLVVLHNQAEASLPTVVSPPTERPLNLTAFPVNYLLVQNSDKQTVRKVTLLDDGEHALEHVIRWEVRQANTPTVMGTSFGPLQGAADAQELILPQVKTATGEGFRLLQEFPQAPGSVVWLGRVGEDWYLLLQGTQRLLRRGDMTAPGSVWVPVRTTGAMPDSMNEIDSLNREMIELSELLVKALPGLMERPVVNQSAETQAYLMVMGHTLNEVENLRTQTLVQVAAWREHRQTAEETARIINEKVSPQAVELLHRFEIAPPEAMLQGLHASMQTTLGCLCAGVALCERALWLNDPVRLQKGEVLLTDADKAGAQTRLKLSAMQP